MLPGFCHEDTYIFNFELLFVYMRIVGYNSRVL